jgi:hypothetical protein
LYNEKHNKIISNLEDKIEEELEGIGFFQTIRAMSPLQKTRDHYYELITDKQNKTIQLLQEFNVEKAAFANLRTPADRNVKAVTTKDININNKYIKGNLRIPQLSGTSNQPVFNEINKNIENDIMEFKRQMEASALESEEEAKKKGIKFTPFSISNVYNITYDKNNILSLTILYYELVGGKNYYIKTSYNYDTGSGSSLSIGDLFKPGTNYKSLINTIIRKQLSQNKNLYFPGTLENFKGIADDQPFYLDDNNLVIFFGFNEIAPLESQIPVIKIPFSQLRNSLNPRFV